VPDFSRAAEAFRHETVWRVSGLRELAHGTSRSVLKRSNSVKDIAALVGLLSTVCVGCGSQRPDFSPAEGSISTSEEAARAEEQEQDEDQESDAARRLALTAGSGSEEDEPIEPMEESDTDAGVDPDIEEQESLADDSSRCGNGILDENEMCDIGITSGEGACPERCEPEPGCPSETMVVRSCWSYCVPNEVPPAECVD
jgi:hypothetical protein